MNRRELAASLCQRVQAKRLERINEPMPESNGNGFDDLPESEKQNWLDMADVVLENQAASERSELLRALTDDWDSYGRLLPDPTARNSMRRAIVVEMRALVEELWAECEVDG